MSAVVQDWFYRTFYKWGKTVAHSPKKVIGISFFVAVLCSIRLLIAPAQPLPSETRQEKLFAPQDSRGVADYERYEASFGFGLRRNTVYITTKPRGGNVLTSAVLAEAQRFDQIVRSELYVRSYKGRDDDEWTEANVTFADICVRGTPTSPCLNSQDPLELFAWANGTYSFGFTDAEILDIVNSRVGIDPALFPAAANRTVNVNSVFGGIERDGSGRITSAEAISLSYTLNNDERDSIEDKQGFAWEEQLNYMIGPEWTDNPPDNTRGAAYPEGVLSFSSTEVELFPFTHGAINREFANSVSGDILTLNIGFICIFLYALFILARCRTPAKSRSMLASIGILSCGIAIAIAYSLGSLFVSLNQVVNVLPFVLIGIGVDDMFVLISSLENIPEGLPVEERVAQGIASAGVSITITSLTDFLAFLLGSTSSLPALSAFCVFAAIGILADFILQITLFAAFMTLDAYREDRGTSDCCCCPCAPKDASEEGAGCCTWYPQLQTLNERYYVPLLRNRFVKAIVLVSFFTFTGIAGWQASNLQQDFERRWFVDSDAQLQQAFIVSDDYFTNTGNGGVRVNIVGPPSTVFDYSLPASQQKMIEMSQAVAASKWMVGASVTPWYQPLRAWVYQCVSTHTLPDTSTCVGRNCALNGVLLFPHCTSKRYLRDAGGDLLLDTNGQPISEGADNKTMVIADGTSASIDTPIEQTYLPPSSFYSYLNQFLFDSPTGGVFTSSFRWVVPNVGNISSSEVEQGLEASQFRITSLYLDTANEQVDSMDDLRKTVESVGIGPDISSYPYTFVYIFYEQFKIIGREALLNLMLALIAVIIITTLFIGSVHASFMVVLCVVMVDVDILGLMYMWGLTIDSVTIINLVLAVGLAVDYSAHVAHAFVVATGTKQERADTAVREMGTAVLHGSLSTFVAVLVLATSQSYVFRVFFKQFFGICLFGLAHGVLFLPVLLSLIGPEPIELSTQSTHTMKKEQEAKTAADNNPQTRDTEMPSAPASPPGSDDVTQHVEEPVRTAWE